MTDPWFRFFPSDWTAGVSGLSSAERGVYITLISIMYDHAAPIERDDARLSRQCGLPKAGFVRALAGLTATGKIILVEGRLFNSRVKIELTERENRKLTATEAARSSWQKRKENQSSENASALQEQCNRNATHARVSQPQPQPDIFRDANASLVPPPDGGSTPSVVSISKRLSKAESDQSLLDRISDRWNAWASSHGSPRVERLTTRRGIQCRRRIADLMQHGHETPEAAFDWLLTKCNESFFARGSPSKPLEFDQLMREEFMTRMVENAFQFKPNSGGQRRWAS